MNCNMRWIRGHVRTNFYFVALGAVVLIGAAGRQASAQLLVNSSNSAIGASSSAIDAAHFQNAGSITHRAAYIGYSAATGAGYMDNTGTLTANGVLPINNYAYDISENWGVGVGVFDG